VQLANISLVPQNCKIILVLSNYSFFQFAIFPTFLLNKQTSLKLKFKIHIFGLTLRDISLKKLNWSIIIIIIKVSFYHIIIYTRGLIDRVIKNWGPLKPNYPFNFVWAD
jgi:hypothetical protein